MQKDDNKVKILLTGGHARATAYAVIQEIKDKHKDWEIYWIGPKSVVEGRKIKSFDDTFSKLDINSKTIHAGRLQTKFTLWTIPSILKIPLGFIHAFFHLLTIKPDIVLSFGGFVAYPVVIVAWLFRIPVIIHEQTIAGGRANIHSARFAKKVALAREESKKYFPKDKTILIGNPVSKEIVNLPFRDKKGRPPKVLITGGASGSMVINEAVEKVLSKILRKFKLVHQTGKLQYAHYKKIRKDLPPKLRKNYEIYSVISKQNWHKYISKADIIISRAGANIVSEIMVAKKPSILIPIPWSVYDEQRKNAEYAKDFGIAILLAQKSLTPITLYRAVVRINKNWMNILDDVKNKKSPDFDASSKLVELMESYIDA